MLVWTWLSWKSWIQVFSRWGPILPYLDPDETASEAVWLGSFLFHLLFWILARTEKENEKTFRTLIRPLVKTAYQKNNFLIPNQNIYCGYSKEPSQWDGSFEHPKHMLTLKDKKIITILRKLLFLNWLYGYFSDDEQWERGTNHN